MNKFSLRGSLILTLLLTAGFSFLISQGCRKMDKPPSIDLTKEKFFRVKSGTDPLVIAIANNIQQQDHKRNLTGKLIKKAGFPIWEKAVISKTNAQGRNMESEQQVFIPFINEDDRETKAILAVKLNGEDTLFSMVYSGTYQQYGFDTTGNVGNWSARDVFRASTYFDHIIFGHDAFYVNDSRLLGTATDTISNQPATIYIDNTASTVQGRLQSPTSGTIIVWITYIHCQRPAPQRTLQSPARVVGPKCFNGTYAQEQVTFHLDENAPGGGYFDQEGGGGGGDTYMCVGCNWEDTNPCNLDPMAPQEPCFDDWQPIPNAVDEPYNENQFDSIYIEDGLENKYPCIADLISDSLPNVNWLSQIAGAGVFKDSAYMHLTFDTSSAYTGPSHPPAGTEPYGVVGIDVAGNTHFSARILLNGWYLRNATQTAIINTIIHESMHAIFELRWYQYQNWLNTGQGTVDSNYIKTHFPIHWSYYMNRQVSPSEEQQHMIMGTTYLNKFVDIGRPFYNPSASTQLRDSVLTAMGLFSLYQTSVWPMLPSMGKDTCAIKKIVETARQSLVGSFNFPGCGTFTTHFSDSLKLTPNCN